METYVALLQGYQTRDKILRTVGFASTFVSGAFKGHTAKSLITIAQNISNARTVNRLFDGVPFWMITRTMGAADRDFVSRALSAVANIVMQLYFPVEKIAWSSELEILPLNAVPFRWAGTAIWGIYMVLNILRSLRQLSITKAKLIRVLKQRKLESPEKSGEQEADYRRQISELRAIQKKELLMIAKNLADLVMVINWLPLGVLWSGKLSPSRNAFFGCISSLLGLYLGIVQYNSTKNKKQ